MAEDYNADTEWNDALRKHGIIPEKEKEAEITEEDLVKLVEDTVTEKSKHGKGLGELDLDELDELEDEEDDRILLEYREKRIREMKEQAKLAKFGEIREISAEDYVQEVNKAGEGVWVVLHLYKPGIPLCTLINQFITELSRKFPATKFLKSVSSTCIPNFPDQNLPTIFVYHQGELIKQFVGALAFGGMNLKIEVLEWVLSEAGAFKTDLEKDPRVKVRDVLFSSLKAGRSAGDSDEDNDW